MNRWVRGGVAAWPGKSRGPDPPATIFSQIRRENCELTGTFTIAAVSYTGRGKNAR